MWILILLVVNWITEIKGGHSWDYILENKWPSIVRNGETQNWITLFPRGIWEVMHLLQIRKAILPFICYLSLPPSPPPLSFHSPTVCLSKNYPFKCLLILVWRGRYVGSYWIEYNIFCWEETKECLYSSGLNEVLFILLMCALTPGHFYITPRLTERCVFKR